MTLNKVSNNKLRFFGLSSIRVDEYRYERESPCPIGVFHVGHSSSEIGDEEDDDLDEEDYFDIHFNVLICDKICDN